MEHKNLLIIFITIILTAIIIGGVVYFLQNSKFEQERQQLQQQLQSLQNQVNQLLNKNDNDDDDKDNNDDTSGWQTYKNEKYGFELKYDQSTLGEVSETYLNYEDNQYINENHEVVYAIGFPHYASILIIVATDSNFANQYMSGCKDIIYSDPVIINGVTFNTLSCNTLAANIIYFTNRNGYQFVIDSISWEKDALNAVDTFKFFESENGSAWQTYQERPYDDLQPHDPWGYEFQYPQEFILNQEDHPDYTTGSFLKTHQSEAGVWSARVAVSVRLDNAYQGTNFQSAWFTVAYDPDIANQENCQEAYRNNLVEKLIDTQGINGVIWNKGALGSAAAGTSVQSKVYHTLHNGMCYEVNLHLATTNMGNYDPSFGITAVNENEIWSKLESILFTFKFIEN